MAIDPLACRFRLAFVAPIVLGALLGCGEPSAGAVSSSSSSSSSSSGGASGSSGGSGTAASGSSASGAGGGSSSIGSIGGCSISSSEGRLVSWEGLFLLAMMLSQRGSRKGCKERKAGSVSI